MTAEEQAYVRRVFPLIAQIGDDGIREKVVEAWVRVWKASDYPTLEEAVMRGPAQNTVVKHTNSVAGAAYTVAKRFHQDYGLPVDFDMLLAGALLHDCCKLLSYRKKGDKVEHTEVGKKVHHAYYGGHIALEVGLPLEVVSLIICHTSPLRAWGPPSVERLFINHCDAASNRSVRIGLGGKESHRLVYTIGGISASFGGASPGRAEDTRDDLSQPL